MYTPTPAAAGVGVLHFTVLFHSVAAHQVPPKRRFFLFFCFSSAPEMTIFLLTRHSATLPMCAKGLGGKENLIVEETICVKFALKMAGKKCTVKRN